MVKVQWQEILDQAEKALIATGMANLILAMQNLVERFADNIDLEHAWR